MKNLCKRKSRIFKKKIKIFAFSTMNRHDLLNLLTVSSYVSSFRRLDYAIRIIL